MGTLVTLHAAPTESLTRYFYETRIGDVFMFKAATDDEAVAKLSRRRDVIAAWTLERNPPVQPTDIRKLALPRPS